MSVTTATLTLDEVIFVLLQETVAREPAASLPRSIYPANWSVLYFAQQMFICI